MLWGSKRTGPDLARIGEKYSDDWQVAHLRNPRDVVPQSVMPAYSWLLKNTLYIDDLDAQLRTLSKLGVPYSAEMIDNAVKDAYSQATPDSTNEDMFIGRYGDDTNLRAFDGDPQRLTEMDALVAYLQILGQLTDVATTQSESNP
jgi:cytochrome c oxidase cbb3-type subunit 2